MNKNERKEIHASTAGEGFSWKDSKRAVKRD